MAEIPIGTKFEQKLLVDNEVAIDFLGMEGAPSHVDTFDYKPDLYPLDGKTIDVPYIPAYHTTVLDFLGFPVCWVAVGFDYVLPFEDVPDGPLQFPNVDGELAGEVTVAAGMIDTGRLLPLR